MVRTAQHFYFVYWYTLRRLLGRVGTSSTDRHVMNGCPMPPRQVNVPHGVQVRRRYPSRVVPDSVGFLLGRAARGMLAAGLSTLAPQVPAIASTSRHRTASETKNRHRNTASNRSTYVVRSVLMGTRCCRKSLN